MINCQLDFIDERRLDKGQRIAFCQYEISGAEGFNQLDTIQRRHSDRDSPGRRLIRDLNVDSAAAIHEIEMGHGSCGFESGRLAMIVLTQLSETRAVIAGGRMDSRLLSDADLVQITGKKRCSTQVSWFKQQFDIDVVTRANGHIIMTWATFEALMAKKVGVLVGGGNTPRQQLHPAKKTR
ncbi:DUF4224 domain-containing protein [Pandoraea sputorum]|uniref:DUF4224 domain-containing protein n=1 Tax=Pandoraea sputorum TaxID=93222 RepID=UPI001CD6F953|nr:DUF4224 domain-containing protein [Pandoraea sputorum]